jgi:hypothetical protein
MPQPKIKTSKSQPNQESLAVGRRESGKGEKAKRVGREKVAGFTHDVMQAEDGEGRICSKPELAKKSKKNLNPPSPRN